MLIKHIFVCAIAFLFVSPALAEAPAPQLPHTVVNFREIESKVAHENSFKPQNAPVTNRNVSEGVEVLLRQFSWEYEIARAVMLAESGGNPRAYNPEWHRGCQGSYGLMQVACIHYEARGIYGDMRFDPQLNMQIAFEIYQESWWRPWGAYVNGSFRRFL